MLSPSNKVRFCISRLEVVKNNFPFLFKSVLILPYFYSDSRPSLIASQVRET